MAKEVDRLENEMHSTIKQWEKERQSKANEARVEHDAYGRINHILTANGKSTDFTRDTAGNVIEIKMGDRRWTKDTNGEGWTRYDKEGRPTSHVDNITVSSSGDVNFYTKDVPPVTIHPDGSRTESFFDGSWVTRDAQRHVTKIESPVGKVNTVTYDKDGNAARLTRPDGSQWTKEGTNWIRRDKDGNEISRVDKITVSESADITFTSRGVLPRTYHPDGSHSEVFPDKSKITTDFRGHVTRIESANGQVTTIAYDKDDKPISFTRPDKSQWIRDGHTWSRRDQHGSIPIDVNDIAVSSNGDIYLKSTQSSVRVIHPNGSHTVHSK